MVKDVWSSYSRVSPPLVNNVGLAAYQDYEEWDMLTMLDTNAKGLMM